MKELGKMTDNRRARLAEQRAQEALMRQAAESWTMDGDLLSGLYRQAEPMLLGTKKSRRCMWFLVAAVVVLVAVPLGFGASLGIDAVHPVPHGNAMNLSADRARAIVSINQLVEKL